MSRALRRAAAALLIAAAATPLFAPPARAAADSPPPPAVATRLVVPSAPDGATPLQNRPLALAADASAGDAGVARVRAVLNDGSTAPSVRVSAGDALFAAGRLAKDDAPALLALAVSSDAAAAALACSLLPELPAPPRRPLVAALRAALARPELFAAAARAAARSPAAAEALAPELLAVALDAATPAARREAAAGALILAAAGGVNPARLGSSPEAVALVLMHRAPTLATGVVRGLLWCGRPVPPAVSNRLLSLPDERLAVAVAVFGSFPDRLDSDFLRAVAATPERPRANAMASSLLATKHSVKNSATLDAISAALLSKVPGVVAGVLENFESDTEFARISGGARAGLADTSDNDRLAGLGNAPASFIGVDALDFRPNRRRVGAHIPPAQRPSIPAILGFFSALEKIAVSGPDLAMRNLAYALLLRESGVPQIGDLLRKILDSPVPGAARVAAAIALRARHEPRLLEIVLQAVAAGKVRLTPSEINAIAPFLVRDNGGRTRLLAAAGRRLAVAPDAERRTLGLVLVGAHGTSDDTALALRLAAAGGDYRVRRAAFFALARLAPEVFAMRELERAADDPDAGVRAIVPLAFALAGFTWEAEVAPGARLAQWARPNSSVPLAGTAKAALLRLASDPDSAVRLNALRTLLQRGLLDAAGAAALLASCPPEAPALFSASLVQSVNAARAAGAAVPAVLARFATPPLPAGAPPPAPPAFAVFVAPGSEQQRRLDETIGALREVLPGVRVEFYFSDAAADAALARLRRRLPVPSDETRKPVLVAAPGVWVASVQPPDFATFALMAAYATATGAERLEGILGLPPLFIEERLQPSAEETIAGMENIADVTTREAEADEEARFHEKLPKGGTFWFFVIVFSLTALAAIAAVFLVPVWRRLPDIRAARRKK